MPRKSRYRPWLIIALLAVVVVAGIFLWSSRRRTVLVEPVASGTAVVAAYATGVVAPVDRVTVRARIGEHLAEVLVKEGDPVVRGQVLARLDDPGRQHALAQVRTRLDTATRQAGKGSPRLSALEAQVRALRATVDLARRDRDRLATLAAAGAETAVARDRARSRAAEAEAQLEAAAQQLRTERLELDSARRELTDQLRGAEVDVAEGEITAPIDGVVLHRLVEPGELVAPNQELFEIADLRRLIVELQVDEADIAPVRTGAPVALSFYAFGDSSFSGHVTEVLPEPDPVRRSFLVEVELDEPIPGLRMGLTAEANVILERRDGALLLPVEAVDGDHAWFVDGGRVTRRPVKLGIRGLTHAELLGGAGEGDLAIVDPALAELAEGDRVRARRSAAADRRR